ncbi:hypothetical protein HWV62_41166 [Athelia sp. TMB]|nr:hypothetical protein HWV62_41166 [Athelia sp. TMB]
MQRKSFQNDANLFPLLDQEKKDSLFGNKGFEVGSIWTSRQALCDSKVHTNVYAGIGKTSGQLGAASVVLSGKYEDDIDEGNIVWVREVARRPRTNPSITRIMQLSGNHITIVVRFDSSGQFRPQLVVFTTGLTTIDP